MENLKCGLSSCKEFVSGSVLPQHNITLIGTLLVLRHHFPTIVNRCERVLPRLTNTDMLDVLLDILPYAFGLSYPLQRVIQLSPENFISFLFWTNDDNKSLNELCKEYLAETNDLADDSVKRSTILDLFLQSRQKRGQNETHNSE